MRFRRPIVTRWLLHAAAVAALVLPVRSAIGQAAPAPRPRMGTAASAPPASAAATVPAASPVVHPGVIYVSPGYEGLFIIGAPYVALADGSIAVDFGRGYERVLRQCAPAATTAAPVDPWARDALGRIPDPPGIAAIRAGTRGILQGSALSRTSASCFRADANGRPVVVSGR